jgi:S1-C subfamily serine protease
VSEGDDDKKDPPPSASGTNLRASQPAITPGDSMRMPSVNPKQAAFEAARIAGEMVGGDVASKSNAAIVAAAAAGAAIEAARTMAAQAPAGDMPDDDTELDPVAIAAAALARIRQRARTDLAGLRERYWRHDLAVIAAAVLLVVGAGWLHRRLVTPPVVTFDQHGLAFAHSAAWLAPEPTPLPAPRLARDPTGLAPRDTNAYHVTLTPSVASTDAAIEVLVDKRPAWSNIVTGLDLDRRTRWGELYMLDSSEVRTINEHGWLRTAYHYAHASQKNDEPRVDLAVEYATVDRTQEYIITLFGTPAEIEQTEAIVAPSLRVATRTPVQLVAQSATITGRVVPRGVTRAYDSTVMVVVADLVDGRLRARGGGSGVIVGRDGSILTNLHVLQDPQGHAHDVFIIGRHSERDEAPQLQCAGRPSRSKLMPEQDLALVKCDMDLDGRTWTPAVDGGIWPTLPTLRSADVQLGQRIWVLGYPDAGGGGLTLAQGEAEGWRNPQSATPGQAATPGTGDLTTDAPIRNGNSGGPVVDDKGRLIGIASDKFTRVTVNGDVVESGTVNVVRPLAAASDLLAIATAGWTPREGHTEPELQPSAVEAPAEGVRIQSHVLDAASEAPVVGALVMVLKPGIPASSVDVNRLDDQVVAWGKSDAQGTVTLKQPVPPGTYSVMVVAEGYEPLIGDGALHLAPDTHDPWDPWGQIWLRSR